MNVQCPACGTVYIVPPENIGKNVECPCGAKFEAVAMPPDPPEDAWSPPVASEEVYMPSSAAPAPQASTQVHYHINNTRPRYDLYTAPVARLALNVCGWLAFFLGGFLCAGWVTGLAVHAYRFAGNTTSNIGNSTFVLLAVIFGVLSGFVCSAFWFGFSALIRLLVQISDQLAERN